MNGFTGPQHRRLYLDNAATSFPKPPAVLEAMMRFATDIGASPGRGAYAESREAQQLVTECRVRLCALFGASDPNQIAFALNTTDALNQAIHGIVAHKRRTARDKPIHIVTTWMDHNSVLRPFNALVADGVQQTRVPVDPQTGIVDVDRIRSAIRPDTALVAVVHASNVTGTLQPIEQIGALCRGLAVPLIVDAAQSLGHVPVDVERMNIDVLCFPGHKGLLGPLGTGGMYIRPGLERIIDPVRQGGTGSVSEEDVQPSFMPDRYEAGSHNTIGIVGLSEGVNYLLDRTIAALRHHEEKLMTTLLDRTGRIAGLRLLGTNKIEDRVGVFSFAHESIPAGRLGRRLESEFGVLTRTGLHCAPLAHATFDTIDEDDGAIRLSLGPFITEADVFAATDALAHVCQERTIVTSRQQSRPATEC